MTDREILLEHVDQCRRHWSSIERHNSKDGGCRACPPILGILRELEQAEAERDTYRQAHIAAVRTCTAERGRAEAGWRGLENIYAMIEGRECDPNLSLGLATSSVDRLKKSAEKAEADCATMRGVLQIIADGRCNRERYYDENDCNDSTWCTHQVSPCLRCRARRLLSSTDAKESDLACHDTRLSQLSDIQRAAMAVEEMRAERDALVLSERHKHDELELVRAERDQLAKAARDFQALNLTLRQDWDIERRHLNEANARIAELEAALREAGEKLEQISQYTCPCEPFGRCLALAHEGKDLRCASCVAQTAHARIARLLEGGK